MNYELFITFAAAFLPFDTSMNRIYILVVGLFMALGTAYAEEHTRFADLPLILSPDDMANELEGHGMRRMMGVEEPYTYRFSGRIAGLEVFLDVNFSKDTTHINHLMMTTRSQQGRSQRDDYSALMQWMRKHYGAPAWESFVRSHAFARWYVGFDHDIVMIATAKSAVEVWFYENHDRRHYDYYAILKYCERNPVDNVPYMTARESVTWRSISTDSTSKKRASKVSKHSRHGKGAKHGKIARRGKTAKRSKTAKTAKKHRRRR